MIKKWLYKKGPGSIGKSTKILANAYLMFSENEDNYSKFQIFESMYNHRKMLNQNFPTQGDLIQILPFETFNHDNIEDLSLFILNVLYHESLKFRRNIHNIDEKTLRVVLEVIYETVEEIVPQSLKLKKIEFIEEAKDKMYWWKMSPIT